MCADTVKSGHFEDEGDISSLHNAKTDKECFLRMMEGPLKQAAEIGSVDIVVGIPFYNEIDSIASVVNTIRQGLQEFYPDQKAVIAAIGLPEGRKCLEVIRQIPQSDTIKHIAFLRDDERIHGKGWAILAAMEIARLVNADLAIIEADLSSVEKDGVTIGFTPDWLHLLLEPVKREDMDLVFPRFNRNCMESPIASFVVYPILTAIYNCPVHDPLGGQWGVSNRMLRLYLRNYFNQEIASIGNYGIDIWLATTAVISGARICETNLGMKIPGSSRKMELKLRHNVTTLFERIVEDRKWWAQKEIEKTPLVHHLPTFGIRQEHHAYRVDINPKELLASFRHGYNSFYNVYEAILPDDVSGQLRELANGKSDGFSISNSIWTRIIYHFLLAFAFNKEFDRGDLINAGVPLFQGRLAGFVLDMRVLWNSLSSLPQDKAYNLVCMQADSQIEALVDELLLQKHYLLAEWEVNEEALKPPIPKVTYREFIPGVHLVVPLEVINKEGNPVSANSIYDTLFSRYSSEFDDFIYNRLGISRDAGSQKIAQQIDEFIHRVERLVDINLLPGDLSTVDGTMSFVDGVLDFFHIGETFSLTPDFACEILLANPPSGLLTRLGYGSLTALLEKYEPNDVLALASWSEEHEYQEGIFDFLRRNVTAEHFQTTALKPVVVNSDKFPSLVEMKESGGLCKLAGRVVVSNIRKGTAGLFPKLRYFTTLGKAFIEIEKFGSIWRKWADEGRDLGDKLINSIEGHWGREPFSAHNMFEDKHQRELVKRLREFAGSIAGQEGNQFSKLAEVLNQAADSYHLAQTLQDGTFIPCSIWSWASFSAKGGIGIPTPLSLHVARDWSSRDFLVEYYQASGGKEETIDDTIEELMGQGRESEDLAPILLGTAKEADAIIQMGFIPPQQPPAGALVRYAGNPVLKPIRENSWEAKYVLNPGAIRLEGKVYLIYRAFGEDNISRLGLAVSENGFDFTERLDKPIFEPVVKSEEKGCEDARLVRIDDRLYMTYTAYNGTVAQIALASITIEDFLDRNWQNWQRHGMVFPEVTNKDAILFPELFDGKYAMLHRVDPHIWQILSPHLSCPWPRNEHKILTGATYGLLWDGKKIGGGAQPVKTRYGWLLIIHGVDYLRVYRLGVLLLDLEDPSVIIYRSPNSILEPKEDYEKGEPGKDWVPNVVFTCGAVPRENGKELLDDNDELLVYYGTADSAIGVACAKISDLIPEQFRQPANRQLSVEEITVRPDKTSQP